VYEELKRIWKEAIMTSFEVLSWHFPGGTEENLIRITGLFADI
jgi:hypothetical protein